MSRPNFNKKKYFSNYKGKVTVEDANKHQQYLEKIKTEANFYSLDHIEGSMIPYSVLHKIIQKLKSNKLDDITMSEKGYLLSQNLKSLVRFVEGEISFDVYKIDSKEDIVAYKIYQEEKRFEEEKVKELELIVMKKNQEKTSLERKLREKEYQERQRKLDSDPRFNLERELRQLKNLDRNKVLHSDSKHITKKNENQKIKNFGIVPKEVLDLHKDILLSIFNTLSCNQRLTEEQTLWLFSKGINYYKGDIKLKYNRLEADHYIQEFKLDNSNWNIINASSHLRKADASQEAESLLETINISSINDKKFCAAYYTVLGGVKRDLRKIESAIELGTKAHHLKINDFKPCTLLGAIYMETSQFYLGHEWYSRARDRGAPEKSINNQLRKILQKLDKENRKKNIIDLLNIDRDLYAWLNEIKT